MDMVAVMRTLKQVGLSAHGDAGPPATQHADDPRRAIRPLRSATATSRRCCRRYEGRRIGASSSHGAERAWPLQRRSPRGDRARHAGVGAALHRDERRPGRDAHRPADRHRGHGRALRGQHRDRPDGQGARGAALPAHVAGGLPGATRADRHSVHGAVDRLGSTNKRSTPTAGGMPSTWRSATFAAKCPFTASSRRPTMWQCDLRLPPRPLPPP